MYTLQASQLTQDLSVDKLREKMSKIQDELANSTGQQHSLIVQEFTGFVNSARSQIELTRGLTDLPAYSADLVATGVAEVLGDWEKLFRTVQTSRDKAVEIDTLLNIINTHRDHFQLIAQLRKAVDQSSFPAVRALHIQHQALVAKTSSPALLAVLAAFQRLLDQYIASLVAELGSPFTPADRTRREDIVSLLIELGHPVDPALLFLEGIHTNLRRDVETRPNPFEAADRWLNVLRVAHKVAALHTAGKVSQRSSATVKKDGLPRYPPLAPAQTAALERTSVACIAGALAAATEPRDALRAVMDAAEALKPLGAHAMQPLVDLAGRLAVQVVDGVVAAEAGRLAVLLQGAIGTPRAVDLVRAMYSRVVAGLPDDIAPDLARATLQKATVAMCDVVHRMTVIDDTASASDELLSSSAPSMTSGASGAASGDWREGVSLAGAIALAGAVRVTVLPDIAHRHGTALHLTPLGKGRAARLRPVVDDQLMLSPSVASAPATARVRRPATDDGPLFGELPACERALLTLEACLIDRHLASRVAGVHATVTEAVAPTATQTTVVTDTGARLPPFAADIVLTLGLAAAECGDLGIQADPVVNRLIEATQRSMAVAVLDRGALPEAACLDLFIVGQYFAGLLQPNSVEKGRATTANQRLGHCLASACGKRGADFPELWRRATGTPMRETLAQLRHATRLYCACINDG